MDEKLVERLFIFAEIFGLPSAEGVVEIALGSLKELALKCVKIDLPPAEVAPENSGRLLWGRLQDFQRPEILPPKM
ncbi:hypothetical protein ACFQ4L_03150 [Lapidilactobacillus mulanensis]|uniref:Uncharacterized protein n=1 Tax=Lapidilactobacillus mulanensis TaxID=2485999 RepID=A0ABW4DMM7_9LACO